MANQVERRQDFALLGLLALVVIVLPGLLGLSLGLWTYESPAQVVVALGMITPLLLYRRAPTVMVLLVAVAGIRHVILADRPLPALVVVPIVAYLVARQVPSRRSRIALALGAIGSLIGPASWYDSDRDWTPEIGVLAVLTCAMMVLVPYIIGRRQLETARVARERQVQTEAAIENEIREREQRQHLSEMVIRHRIATELDDIISHSVSQMVIQAQGGQAMATKRPDLVEPTLGEIAETGREALSEIRRVVGLLRARGPESEDRSSADSPPPG